MFNKLKVTLLSQAISLALLFGTQTVAAEGAFAQGSLTDIPLEDLVQAEMITASSLARQVSDSPSAVSIVTSDDIRDFGYRTLADALNGMRGLYTTYDHRYDYLGGRGFGRPGDYAGRVMLLIDGYASQDSLYNQAYIDHSALVDMALVDRIEYVPGTGSVTYGNNAMLGIVNVVTKKGQDFRRTEVSGDWFSRGGARQRITYGNRFENGTDLLLSASSLESNGIRNYYMPAYNAPSTNYGIAQNLDGERAEKFFAKLTHGGLTVEGAFSTRKKMAPFPPNARSKFNAPYWMDDGNGFLNVRYETDINLNLKSSTRFYHGYYADRAFREFAALNSNGAQYRQNDNKAKWAGFEQTFVANWFRNHVLLLGAEYRRDYSQHIHQDFLGPNSQVVATLDFGSRRSITSFFITDEYSLGERWRFNFGARLDSAQDSGGIRRTHASPRFAAIYAASTSSTWKASYSEAFRFPSADDRSNYEHLARSEKVAASELVFQHHLQTNTRFTGTLYRYQLSQLTAEDPVSGNTYNHWRSHTNGIETEVEHTGARGLRVRASTAWQTARDVHDKPLANSPRWLTKLAISSPMAENLRIGWESLYLGRRYTDNDRELKGALLSHLTFSVPRPIKGFSANLSIRNVFDKRLEVAAPFVRTGSSGQIQDSLLMDGRTVWLQLTYGM